MAKSTRSKVKRAYRAKKRESGVYAVAEAARLHRLNAKLTQVIATDDMPVEESGKGDDSVAADESQGDERQSDTLHTNGQKSARISTHGPRNSRHEEWRRSKGMPARRVSKEVRWQRGTGARRKVGRSRFNK